MLDQLVESKDTFKGLRTLLVIVAIVLLLSVGTVFGKFLWDLNSLFGFFQKGGMSGDLELTSLVAPVPVQPDEPPPVEEQPKKEPEKNLPNVDTRTEIIQRIDQSPTEIPDKPSVEQNKVKPPREGIKTVVGSSNQDFQNSVKDDYKGDINQNPSEQNKCQGIDCSTSKNDLADKDDAPKVEKKEPTPSPKPIPKTVSGGVVNGKARNLVTPQYPSAARAVRASGQVSVAVTIDENGNVISANAVSGHTLLRSAAESAARSSKFNPTLLSGQPVKVTGTIIYNFVP